VILVIRLASAWTRQEDCGDVSVDFKAAPAVLDLILCEFMDGDG